MLGKQLIQAAAGAAGAGGAALYVDDVFSTFLYNGTHGGTTNTITNGLDLSGEGGLVWMKGRSVAHNHFLISSDNNFQGFLYSNSSNARVATSTSHITALNDGFRMNFGGMQYNDGGQTYASWSFRKAPGFFDVVAYTGNSSSGQTISHNLGSAPGVMIIKSTSTAENWVVYSKDLYESLTGNFRLLSLNTAGDAGGNISRLNSTQPTSSVFTVGLDANTDGDDYVAYLFASDDAVFGTDSDESIIKCGTYTGNGSTQEINLGFEPQWFLAKRATGADYYGWLMWDTMRGMPVGASDALLRPNLNGTELNYDDVDPTSTGLIVKSGSGAANASGATYMYMAIRRPHKPPTAGTDVFLPAAVAGNSDITTGFPVDLAFQLRRTSGSKAVVTRVTGKNSLETRNTNAETTNSNAWYDSNTQLLNTGLFTADSAFHLFKRAPGFLDVVAYSAASGDLTVPHSLGVTPEMIIIKSRNHTSSWKVWHSGLSAGTASTNYNCNLDDDAAEAGPNANIVSYSNTNFIVGNGRTATNKSSVNGTYIAYLFATLPDISKVGSYTGTGNAINVDCGFSSGARFILIKRSDSTGDWFVYDSARGIVSGDDPYLLLNSNAAEVTNTDYIDPLSSGFTVTSSAPTGLNASGGTYIFLAIA